MGLRALACAAAFAASMWAPGAAFAHHSFSAEYSRDMPVTVTGTVTKIEWLNPHARFYVEVNGEDGQTVSWDFELASPNTLMRRGWKHDTLKPGDPVTVEGFRARNAANVANASKVTLADGTRVFSSPRE